MDWYYVILIAANIPLYLAVGWGIFSTWENFWEALRFCFTPDVFSMFRGEWAHDMWGEVCIGLWLAVCGLTVYGEHLLLTKYVFG